jgi:transglutaminase-like putative cysteine protease
MTPVLPRLPMLLLLATFAAGCILQADRVPAWCALVALGALAWRWLNHRGRLALPNQVLRVGLALLLLLGVLVSFRTLNGRAAGSALLMVMGAAKLLETRTARDAVVMTIVSLVLVLAAALDRQSLGRLPLYLGTAWLALACLAAIGNVRSAQSVRFALFTAGRTALYSLPLAALCFVLVPRLPGALWTMPGGARATTGLSEQMSPGSISDLAISEDIAFRVRFDGAPPPPESRYWRGPVLHNFDGYTWSRSRQIALSQDSQPLSAPLGYHVMLEPQGNDYLFTLDYLDRIDNIRYYRLFDGEVHARQAISVPTLYDAVSHLQARSSDELSILGRRMDTRLPEGRNPRSVALAQQLRATAASDADYAARVMDFFRNGGFEYSLTPPLVDHDSIDNLLFKDRLGYCGHFASAFVMLMRAAGIPARIVTGYLGGTWNGVGGYYTVRQSDAHAWAEVWVVGRGWTRFDPTSVVAPERMERTAADVLAGRRDAAGALLGEAGWLNRLRDTWEAAGGWWQEQVVNFNRARQLDLLAKFGLDKLDYGGMALLLILGGTAWVLLLFLILSRRAAQAPRDALARLWERFQTMLRRRGVEVADHDGPDAIRHRARAQLPQAAGEIDLFAAEYMRLRFGGGDTTDARALSLLKARLSSIARATAAHRRRRTAPAAPG